MTAEQQIKVEITGRDEFWQRAFHVEWEHQFPNRTLRATDGGQFLVKPEWLKDLERVAGETFCRVLLAPDNRRRREWLSSIINWRDR